MKVVDRRAVVFIEDTLVPLPLLCAVERVWSEVLDCVVNNVVFDFIGSGSSLEEREARLSELSSVVKDVAVVVLGVGVVIALARVYSLSAELRRVVAALVGFRLPPGV